MSTGKKEDTGRQDSPTVVPPRKPTEDNPIKKITFDTVGNTQSSRGTILLRREDDPND